MRPYLDTPQVPPAGYYGTHDGREEGKHKRRKQDEQQIGPPFV